MSIYQMSISWRWIGKPGILQSMGGKESDMTELNCPYLILETQEYVIFHGKRDSATVIKLRILLKGEDYLGLSDRPVHSQESL